MNFEHIRQELRDANNSQRKKGMYLSASDIWQGRLRVRVTEPGKASWTGTAVSRKDEEQFTYKAFANFSPGKAVTKSLIIRGDDRVDRDANLAYIEFL